MTTLADIVANLEPELDHFFIERRADCAQEQWEYVRGGDIATCLRTAASLAPSTSWRITYVPAGLDPF